MLYRRGPARDQQQTRIVNDEEELLAALEQGWSRTPAPCPPGFPVTMVEKAMRVDYRKVRIRNPQELTLFQQVANPDGSKMVIMHSAAGPSP